MVGLSGGRRPGPDRRRGLWSGRRRALLLAALLPGLAGTPVAAPATRVAAGAPPAPETGPPATDAAPAGPDLAQPDWQRFLAAEQAWAAGDRASWRLLTDSLTNYPLYPYLRATELLAGLDQTVAEPVRDFIDRFAGSAPAERVRAAWLARLARERRWPEYLAAFRDNGDTPRQCQYRRALLATGRSDEAFADLAGLYLTGASLPKECDPLLADWAATGALTPALAWQRIDLALARNDTGVAAFQRRYLPAAEQPWLDLLLKLHRTPASLTGAVPGAAEVPDPARRAAILAYGLERLARKDPAAAAAVRDRLAMAGDLAPAVAERADLAIGVALARVGDAAALGYLARLPARLDNLEAQHARLTAARRLAAWRQLADWAALLPATPHARGDGEWDWWRGRALIQLGDRPAAAHAFAAAADGRTLWGFLAADLLGRPPALRPRPTPVDQAALDGLIASGIGARVAELERLGRAADIRREWRALTAGLTGPALISAPVLAASLGLVNEAILTQARGDFWDDLDLRFPLAYRPLVRAAAAAHGLPEDWVFAVIRQESAFNPDIASPAGAVGLMQLMPATAAEVADRRGEPAPGRNALTDPARNIRLGADYLAAMRQRFDGHPLPATAAYNAGPDAVGRWVGAPVAGDLWLVNIPYQETRDYVRRVLTYRVIYRHRLGLAPLRLNALVGRVGVTAPSAPPAEVP